MGRGPRAPNHRLLACGQRDRQGLAHLGIAFAEDSHVGPEHNTPGIPALSPPVASQGLKRFAMAHPRLLIRTGDRASLACGQPFHPPARAFSAKCLAFLTALPDTP